MRVHTRAAPVHTICCRAFIQQAAQHYNKHNNDQTASSTTITVAKSTTSPCERALQKEVLHLQQHMRRPCNSDGLTWPLRMRFRPRRHDHTNTPWDCSSACRRLAKLLLHSSPARVQDHSARRASHDGSTHSPPGVPRRTPK